MKLLGLIITAMLLGFSTNHVPMTSNLHENMCHGADCADMTPAVANDVACALHCLSAAAPFQANSPEISVLISLFLIVSLGSNYVLRFKNDLAPRCAGSPHFKFLQKLHLASVVIRS